jgi:hypothetical protein
MDVDGVPAQLERIGPPELQIFRRRGDPSVRAATSPGVPRSPSPRPVLRRPDPVEIHERVLAAIENGEGRIAERMLADLNRTFPTYLRSSSARCCTRAMASGPPRSVDAQCRRAEFRSRPTVPGPSASRSVLRRSATGFLRSLGERE